MSAFGVRADITHLWSRPKQTNRSPLIPIRPRIRTDSAADCANHARPERRHRHLIGKGVYVQNRLMMTPQRTAGDCQRAHAIFAYVAQGHHASAVVRAVHLHYGTASDRGVKLR
jgi:hypothetical protein